MKKEKILKIAGWAILIIAVLPVFLIALFAGYIKNNPTVYKNLENFLSNFEHPIWSFLWFLLFFLGIGLLVASDAREYVNPFGKN